MHEQRMDRVRAAMARQKVDVLLLSVGADLPWLVGYEAMPLERLTMLVLPADGEATLVVPRLEAPRVVERPDVFRIEAWDETDDPVALVAERAGSPRVAAVGNRTWSQFVVELLRRLPGTEFRNASDVVGPLRAVKDPAEVQALRAAAAAVDRIAAALQSGAIPLIGRTEADVAAELARRILAEGHHRVNFTIVAAGENAASPHHEAGARVIRAGEVVLCDFGGTMLFDGVGYCSDITRCVYTGAPPAEFRDLYQVLHDAQHAAVQSAVVGQPAEDVDGVARRLITEGGYGDYFIHRTGHGIGVEEHEDPYIVAGNCTALVPGHAFSIEPGIYVPGRWGARLEDIVVASADGPDALNTVDHSLAVVDAVIGFDGASLLLQWATGGLLFLWVTTRRREVSLGYGWLMRGVYALMAAGAFLIGVFVIAPLPVRDVSSFGVAVAASVALVVSILRRGAGVSLGAADEERRTARVAAMTGIEREPVVHDTAAPEFPPVLDLIAPIIGVVGVVASALDAGGPTGLAIARFLVGAAFLGAVTDAMLLGHWYLVQPGLARGALLEMVRWVQWLLVPEVVLLLVPTGMVSVINGTIDDGYGGLLGWFWIACVVTTAGLIVVTRLALKERYYSAVMAATGLLYLAILTAFGVDLVARALLST